MGSCFGRYIGKERADAFHELENDVQRLKRTVVDLQTAVQTLRQLEVHSPQVTDDYFHVKVD